MNRRDAISILGATGMGLMLDGEAAPAQSASVQSLGSARMTVTCVIRYQIDPFQRDAFAEYARNWGRVIPECGGHLVGYFLPYEGTNDVGWGLIAFDSLSAYERYKTKLKTHPGAVENFAMARTKRFILREERNFVEVVDGTFEIPPHTI